MPAATPAKAPTRIAGPDKPTHLHTNTPNTATKAAAILDFVAFWENKRHKKMLVMANDAKAVGTVRRDPRTTPRVLARAHVVSHRRLTAVACDTRAEASQVHRERFVGYRSAKQERKGLRGFVAETRKRSAVQQLTRINQRNRGDDGQRRRPSKPHIGDHVLTRPRIKEHREQEHLQRIKPYLLGKDTARYAQEHIPDHDGKCCVKRRLDTRKHAFGL